MKLFKIATHTEGEYFEDNVFLTIGKRVGLLYPRCSADPEKLTDRGWYVRLQLPFKKFMKYRDPRDFELKEGYCQKLYYWRISKEKPMINTSVWKPIAETNYKDHEKSLHL